MACHSEGIRRERDTGVQFKMARNSLKSSLLLALAAFIWGFAFVAQSDGMNYVGAFTFNTVRFLLGGIVLLPFIYLSDRNKTDKDKAVKGSCISSDKTVLTGGILCGIALFAASSFQQIGIAFTTVGKAGFITAMYVVIVPVLSIFLGKKARWNVWVSVAIAVAGLYLLCINGVFIISFGDGLELICALFFSIQIMLVDHFSPITSGIKLSCIQFFVCGLMSFIPALMFETIDISQIFAAWIPILYTGVFSCGIAYTLQIIGQKNTDPQLASLIMSLESVFSVIGGWIILGQAMSIKELSGCILMFAAIILAQCRVK